MELPAVLRQVMQLLKPVADDFTSAGYRLYLVGGVVRDVAFGVGRDISDLDLTTDAHPPFISSVLESHASVLWTQGERFGTIGAQIGGNAVEITTHRTETYTTETRKPDVNFGDSLDVDLSRRDFTINAMAISIPDGEFFDPYGGLGHVDQRLLVTPIDPTVSFSDDPLRMLRAARFLPRFDLAPDETMLRAASDLANRLDVVSRERISVELDRLLQVDDPALGFDFLLEVGLLSWAIPALGSCSTQDLGIASSLAALPGSVDVRRAGLLYILSKSEGPATVQQALAQLRYSVDVQNRTKQLLSQLDSVLVVQATIQTVRRLIAELNIAVSRHEPNQFLVDLRQLAENVAGSVSSVQFDGSFFDLLDVALERSEILHYQAPLSGNQIMKLLDMPAGPIIGQAKNQLRDRWIATGENSAEEAERWLLLWKQDL